MPQQRIYNPRPPETTATCRNMHLRKRKPSIPLARTIPSGPGTSSSGLKSRLAILGKIWPPADPQPNNNNNSTASRGGKYMIPRVLGSQLQQTTVVRAPCHSGAAWLLCVWRRRRLGMVGNWYGMAEADKFLDLPYNRALCPASVPTAPGRRCLSPRDRHHSAPPRLGVRFFLLSSTVAGENHPKHLG